MTPEFIAIISVGVALAGLLVASQRWLRSEIGQLRDEISDLHNQSASLRERMAHLGGLLEGLRAAVSSARTA